MAIVWLANSIPVSSNVLRSTFGSSVSVTEISRAGAVAVDSFSKRIS